MKKYEGITFPIHGSWDLERFRAHPARGGGKEGERKDMKQAKILSFLPHISSGTWKNFELSPLYKLWDLEKFRASPPYRFWDLEKFRASPSVWALELGRAKRGASRRIYLSPYIQALRLTKIPSSPHKGSKIWKNSELHPPYLYKLWN